MNVELLSPFLQDYPEEIRSTFEDTAQVARFNPSGFYAGAFLAVGRADGYISVWDVETKNVVWVGQGHVKSVETIW
jgi:COMPASS component SWD1